MKPDGYKTRKAFITHNNKHHPEAQRFKERLNDDLDYGSDDDYSEEEEEEEE